MKKCSWLRWPALPQGSREKASVAAAVSERCRGKRAVDPRLMFKRGQTGRGRSHTFQQRVASQNATEDGKTTRQSLVRPGFHADPAATPGSDLLRVAEGSL